MRAIAAGCLAGALLVSAARAGDAPGRTGDPEAGAPPTLEELRGFVLKRGVPPGLARIEAPASGGAPGETSAPPAGRDEAPRRLVFWTRTRRLTQSIIVAVVGGAGDAGGAYVRIQSAGLALAPAGHRRTPELMAYVLDRNFVLAGAQFARDAADGEVVLRADVPCASGISEADFMQAVESVLTIADDESVRLKALVGDEGAPASARPAGRAFRERDAEVAAGPRGRP